MLENDFLSVALDKANRGRNPLIEGESLLRQTRPPLSSGRREEAETVLPTLSPCCVAIHVVQSGRKRSTNVRLGKALIPEFGHERVNHLLQSG